MTARQKRNAIIWPIVGGIPLLIILSFIMISAIKANSHKKMVERALNTYNVKYSSREPLMEFVRKSEEETEANGNYMDGYIYINGEKKDFRCAFAKRHPGHSRIWFENVYSGERIFEAYYTLKGNTLTLTPYFSDYVVGEYKTITLTMTHLD